MTRTAIDRTRGAVSLGLGAALCAAGLAIAQPTVVPGPAAAGEPARKETSMFSRSEGYERYMGRWSRLLVPGHIAFAGVRDGERVLDVGTGTGALAGALVHARPASQIVGIDPAEAFVAYARSTVPSPRVRFDVGDARAMPYPAASFDQTMALLVVNFIPDADRAITEMRRVTRPGGVVSACVWDYDSGMRMTRLFWDEAVAMDPTMAAKDQRGMRFAKQGELGEAWRQAGLVEVRERPLDVAQPFASFDDYWLPFLEGAGAAGAFVGALPAAERSALEARLRRRVLGDGPDGPFSLDARAWCVRGRAP